MPLIKYFVSKNPSTQRTAYQGKSQIGFASYLPEKDMDHSSPSFPCFLKARSVRHPAKNSALHRMTPSITGTADAVPLNKTGSFALPGLMKSVEENDKHFLPLFYSALGEAVAVIFVVVPIPKLIEGHGW